MRVLFSLDILGGVLEDEFVCEVDLFIFVDVDEAGSDGFGGNVYEDAGDGSDVGFVGVFGAGVGVGDFVGVFYEGAGYGAAFSV